MTEQKHVWHVIRAHLPTSVHPMRLENLVGTGMPDINLCMNGVEVWVEAKMVKGNRIIFQPTQPAWITKRVRAGGRVFVVARHKDAFLVWFGWHPEWTDTSTVMSDGCIAVDYRTVTPLLKMEPPYDWPLLLEVLFTRKTPRFVRAESTT